MAQLPRDIGQPGAEQETMHPVPFIGDGMQEMQQDLRITRHAAANVTQHHQGRRLFHALLVFKLQDITTKPQALAKCGAQIHNAPSGMRAKAPRRFFIKRQGQLTDFLLGCGDFSRRHGFKIQLLQLFAVTHREAHILARRFRLRRARLWFFALHGFRQTPRRRRRLFRLRLMAIQRGHGSGMGGGFWVTPE